MPRTFTIAPLQPEEIRPAFALVRTAWPEVTLPAWRRFAAGATRAARTGAKARRGLIAARAETGAIVGLYAYSVDRDPALGAVLRVDHLIALDLVDRAAVTEALLGSLDSLAAALGCDAIRTILGARQDGITSRFFAAGHHVSGLVLARPTGPSHSTKEYPHVPDIARTDGRDPGRRA